MHIYRCELQLHDMVYFATREMGRLYETGKYFHNFALTYALQFVFSDYYIEEQIPRYQHDFEGLNRQGIYVTPAKPMNCDFLIHTFKLAQTWYHVEMEKPKKNIPGYGRVKELAPESTFVFFVLSHTTLSLPKWIRLGKWMGKASLQAQEISEVHEKTGNFVVSHPLNPLDLPSISTGYDLISMPPVSLVNNGRFTGEFYEGIISDDLKVILPKGMRYFAAA